MPIEVFFNGNITKYLAYGPCHINQIVGVNNQSTTLYIQLHACPVASVVNPRAPDFPSLQILSNATTNAAYAFTLDINLGECTIAISTTPDVYTAAGAGVLGAVTIDTRYDATVTGLTNFTVVGDLTTLVSNVNIWTNASGLVTPNRLLRVDCVESSGVNPNDLIIMYGDDGGSDAGSIFFSKALPLSTTTTMFFGRNFNPYSRGYGTNSNTIYKGLTIGRSTGFAVPSTFGIGSHTMAIRALYANAA